MAVAKRNTSVLMHSFVSQRVVEYLLCHPLSPLPQQFKLGTGLASQTSPDHDTGRVQLLHLLASIITKVTVP